MFDLSNVFIMKFNFLVIGFGVYKVEFIVVGYDGYKCKGEFKFMVK